MLGYWLFMLIVDLLLPFSMIGFGKMFQTNAPKDVNSTFGYRTAMSMKNRDTWDFAHRYCGRLWVRLGVALVPFSVIPLLFVLGKEMTPIAAVGVGVCAVQLVPLIGSVLLTERALKKTFDQDGKRKSGE